LKGKDRREQVIFPEINNFPHNCIGWLIGKNSSNSTVIGTGFLISSSFVLTSAHTIREIISNDLFGS
jgi:V8-like Glu-specific endopeptidase